MSNKYNNKNFTTYSTKVKYVLTEQETAALKAIGKMLSKVVRKDSPIRSEKGMKKNVSYSVRRKEKSVQIGIRRKTFYAAFVELGTKHAKPYGFFMAAYRRNRDKMQEMVKDYLRELDKK